MLWSYDIESGHWSKMARSDTEDPREIAPWNLVHHSAFKVDKEHLGVIWYDSKGATTLPHEIDESIVINSRKTMISIYSFGTNTWRNLRVGLYGESSEGMEAVVDYQYNFGASIYPCWDFECGCVNKVLLFGGADLRDPSEDQDSLRVVQIDLIQNLDGDYFE